MSTTNFKDKQGVSHEGKLISINAKEMAKQTPFLEDEIIDAYTDNIRHEKKAKGSAQKDAQKKYNRITNKDKKDGKTPMVDELTSLIKIAVELEKGSFVKRLIIRHIGEALFSTRQYIEKLKPERLLFLTGIRIGTADALEEFEQQRVEIRQKLTATNFVAELEHVKVPV